MSGLNEVFSDYFASKDNYLTRVDAKIKMIFVFAAILIIISSRLPYVPAIVFLLSLAFLLSIRIPFKVILARMLVPLTMAIVVAGVYFIFYKGTKLAGLLIIAKVAGCTSLVIFLSMTTPVNGLLSACFWFRIPKTWIEIAAITYRYVFVLIEDAITIRDAQKVRLGYSNLSRSLQSFVELAGSVFIRAYDQSVSTCEAMRMRGYTGVTKFYFKEKFEAMDVLHLAFFSIILFLLFTLHLYWRK